MSVKVYQYGLLSPSTNGIIVNEQMRFAHNYRNTLTEVERARRNAVRILTRENDTKILELEKKVAKAKEKEKIIGKEIKLQHQETRSRTSTKTDKEDLKQSRKITKELRAQLRLARKELKNNNAIQSEIDLINERANEMIRSIRSNYSEAGLYWGNYLIVEDAMTAVKKSPLYKDDQDNDPRFARWRDEGTIAVQLQGGLDTKSISDDKNTLVRINKVDDGAFYAEKRSERKKLSRTVLHIRVGSDEKGKPIWASFPMIMHRSLPENGKIKWIKVHKKKQGSNTKWYVDFTVDITNVIKAPNNGKGAIAIDIGWRDMGDGFRVAKWRGEDGEIGEIKIDDGLVKSLKKDAELRSIRDKEFNIARIQLAEWLEKNVHSDWMTEKTKTISQWKSIDRLAKLVQQWKSNRFEGDDKIFQELENWRYHDFHLKDWEINQRRKSRRHRRELYRVIGAQLAEKYETVIFEDFDLRDVSMTPQPDAKEDNQKARANKTLASPSEFRLVIENAFVSRDGKVEKIDPKGTSYTCHLCKAIEHLDSSDYIHTCSGCGETWDREDNATANILARWCERRDDVQNMGDAHKEENNNEINGLEETRYDRRKRLRNEKEVRMATARKVDGKAA